MASRKRAAWLATCGAVGLSLTLVERGNEAEPTAASLRSGHQRQTGFSRADEAAPGAADRTKVRAHEAQGRDSASRAVAVRAELRDVDRWFGTLAPDQRWMAERDELLRTTALRGEKLGVQVDRAECRAEACRVEITHLQKPPRDPEVVRLGSHGRLFRFEENGKWKSVAFFPPAGSAVAFPSALSNRSGT